MEGGQQDNMAEDLTRLWGSFTRSRFASQGNSVSSILQVTTILTIFSVRFSFLAFLEIKKIKSHPTKQGCCNSYEYTS